MDQKKEVNNYRPISLISNLAKVFEKIIYSRLYNFVIKNHLISANQFGFLKNRRANDAIALLSDYVYEKLGCSEPIIVSFLDYSKRLILWTIIFFYKNSTEWE